MFQEILLLHLTLSGNSLRQDNITRIQIVRAKDQNTLFDEVLPAKNQLGAFAKVAKELYQQLQYKHILCVSANLKCAFLKHAYKELSFSLKLTLFDITQLAELLYEKLYPSLSDLIAFLDISTETLPESIELTQHIYEKIALGFSNEEIQAGLVKLCNGSSYGYELKKVVDDLPNSPGVYIFYNNASVPIYIGKSIHIKQRVESHFAARYRDSKELKLFQKTKHICYEKTSGELGALLLESQLVKRLRPIYNQRLRRLKNFYSFVLSKTVDGYHFLELSSKKIEYGIFRSQRQAMSYLTNLAVTHVLCHLRLGLEKNRTPCFAYQLKRCKGACTGEESAQSHNKRLLFALSDTSFLDWPFEGAIAIYENEVKSDYHYHVFDQWRYYGSTGTLKEAKSCQKQRGKVLDDVDAIKYIKKFLNNKAHQSSIHNLY